MVAMDIFEGLFVQFTYDGRVLAYRGVSPVGLDDWQSYLLDCLAQSYDLESSEFYIGSGRAFPYFTSSGWRFRFFNPLEFDRRSLYSFRLFPDGRSDVYSPGGVTVPVCSWFQLYLSYLSDREDVTRVLFRSWDGDFYRVLGGEDWLGYSLSLIRFGIDAVSVVSVQTVEV